MASDDLSVALDKLKLSETIDEQETSIEELTNFISNEEEKSESFPESIKKSNIFEKVLKILEESSNVELSTKCCQLIAELAKTESLRQPLVSYGFISPLLKALNNDYVSLSTQACRALGNICYDNDLGRNKIAESDGIIVLINLLKSQMEKNDSENLLFIACGFLLNLTNTHGDLQDKSLDNDVLDILNQCLITYKDEDRLINMVLLTLSSLSDSDNGRDKMSESKLVNTLVDLMIKDSTYIHAELIMDILITLTESENVKEYLADTELSNHLIKIIQDNVGRGDEDNEDKIKMASDLLVSLLVGDQSMELLFKGGEGNVFAESIKWLSSGNYHLQTSGALAIGNFARNDEHCCLLVEKGILDHLLRLLEFSESEDITTLLHAVLSALRNLAIPVNNKPKLIKAGVIESVLKLMSSESKAVVFKLLGVLRMLIDGQVEAAILVGGQKELLIQTVEWCETEDHAGVRGEAVRLLAWLVKNSKSTCVMKNIIQANGLQHLVAMTTSEHVVMQNEALIALTLISSSVLEDAAVPLKDADVAKVISEVLKNPSTLPEILCNTLTLTKTICSAGSLREELCMSGIATITTDLTQHSNQNVQDTAKDLLKFLEESSLYK